MHSPNGLLEWLKNKIFKQGIGIAEKSLETTRDCWSGNVNPKSLRILTPLKCLWITESPIWITSLFENFIFLTILVIIIIIQVCSIFSSN